MNYQAASQFKYISHILGVTGHMGSKNLLELSLNVFSEGTSLWGCRASIKGLVVSLQLSSTVIQGPIFFELENGLLIPAMNLKKIHIISKYVGLKLKGYKFALT